MPAPIGNKNAAKNRKWRDAINRVLEHWPDKPETPLKSEQGLHEAAWLFVRNVMKGEDLGYFKEIGDRLDGKPAQALIGGDEDDPAIRLETIAVKLVKADGA